jgi:glycosyltransferase involved in cell wall biosynthesis
LPLLSTESYNGENYLRKAVESILNQTFTDFELIIRDNASTDDTETICRTFAAQDSRILYIRDNQNRGAAHNYNQVFLQASGKYFRWAAHDDILAESNIERCFNYLEAHPSVVLCYPKTLIIDKHGNITSFYDDDMNLLDDDPVTRLKKFWLRHAAECNAVFGLIRSDALRRTRLIGAYNSSDYITLANLVGQI